MTTLYRVSLRTDGRYDYTSTNGSGEDVSAVGYCAGWHELTAEQVVELLGADYVGVVQAEQEKLSAFKAKYHEGGHATPAEAEACFDEFQIDNYFTISHEDERRECADCGGLTIGRIGLRGPDAMDDEWPACEKHQSRKVLTRLREAARARRRVSRA